MKSEYMDPRLVNLIKKCAAALDGIGVPYGVGGSIAMRAHGYSRETTDVDVYALDENKSQVLRALRNQQLTVAPVFQPVQYVAYDPDDNDQEIKIDVMFPATEPELSGIENSERATVAGTNISVFSVNLLIATKFYSDRYEDHRDIAAMLNRGLFDPDEVKRLIESIDQEGAAAFSCEIAEMLKPRLARKRPVRMAK